MSTYHISQDKYRKNHKYKNLYYSEKVAEAIKNPWKPIKKISDNT